MAVVEVVVPSLGEGVEDVTIIKWLKNVGESVQFDETLVEIATDKVDSEIPSPESGILKQINYQENSTANVGAVIALIETELEDVNKEFSTNTKDYEHIKIEVDQSKLEKYELEHSSNIYNSSSRLSPDGRFLSPLVRKIITDEKLTANDIVKIQGTGLNKRITKEDVLEFINSSNEVVKPQKNVFPKIDTKVESYSANDVTIIEMDRMRKLIAEHMVHSIQVSPHVTSFIETDASAIVYWREKYKENFFKKYNTKLTYTHIILEAIIKAIKDFPRINSSLDGDKIIEKKYINLGIATALPSGNLIVPVLKNSENKTLADIALISNDLTDRARNNKLQPTEIQSGTFTVTNIGTFGSIAGTPIINQPQVAILAIGAIVKKPAVISTEYGDSIGIKQQLILSLAYDHRIVDGALGGMFLQKVSYYIENFDVSNSF